ncbi:nicotinamide n-methyltransferase [Arachnomyces sp. PD_36]|nr:nicotinamide n-methyltransferase [Arachnomyces sp. PD_36]
MGSDHEGDVGGFGDMFQDPEGFLQPEKPDTFVEHQMRSGQTLKLRLVGNHPLYGHLLWNAGKTASDYLEERAAEVIQGKDVLELGAGGGLPSLVCAVKGARNTVVTDYPDVDLVENLRWNAAACESLRDPSSALHVAGYKWGASPDNLFEFLPAQSSGFDVLILADVIYNRPEHHNLVSSIQKTLKKSPDSVAFVIFTPYQPWLLEKVRVFFPLAEAGGFTVTPIFEKIMDNLLFEDDPGDQLLRRTVFGYELRWKEDQI